MVNASLIIKSVVSLIIITVIVIGAVFAIKAITNATKTRCDVGLVWNSFYSKCVVPCLKSGHQQIDPVDFTCKCYSGFTRDDSGDCVLTSCTDSANHTCGDTCIPKSDACCNGIRCYGLCYNSTASSPTACCEYPSMVALVPCTTGPTGAKCYSCVMPHTGGTGGTGGTGCPTGLHWVVTECQLRDGSMTASGMCVTGASGALFCPADSPVCYQSHQFDKKFVCCASGASPDNVDVCCADDRKIQGTCCPTDYEICTPKDGSVGQCCPPGFGCDPKSGTCMMKCGPNPKDLISENGVATDNYFYCDSCTLSDFNEGKCTHETVCEVTSTPKGDVYTCAAMPQCSGWDTQPTFYPNLPGSETKTTPVYCDSPIPYTNDTCSTVVRYCKIGAEDVTNWTRKVVLGYGDGTPPKPGVCSTSDCVKKAVNSSITDYVNYDTYTGQCSWSEVPDANLLDCQAATCPKTTSSEYCCDSTSGVYHVDPGMGSGFTSGCSQCGLVGQCVDPSKQSDLDECLQCGGSTHGTCNGACVCKNGWGGQYCGDACLSAIAPWGSTCPADRTCMTTEEDNIATCVWQCPDAKDQCCTPYPPYEHSDMQTIQIKGKAWCPVTKDGKPYNACFLDIEGCDIP
jgi:hypothetical protein